MAKLIINSKQPKGEDGYRTFSVRLKKELVEQLDDVCAKTGHSRNELVGTFLNFALQHYEIKKSE